LPLLILLIELCQFSSCKKDNATTLRILGLFPYRRSPWDGEYVIPAVRLARDEINKNDSILPGYELELIETNSGCTRDRGVRQFVSNALHVEHQPVAILGAGCSSSTILIASIAGRDDVRLPQLSYGATSLFLSLTISYPYFYRTVPTDASTSEAIVSLMNKFKWTHYGIHNAGIGTPNQILTEHAITTLRAGMQNHIPGSREVYFGSTNRDASFEDQSTFREDLHSTGMRVGVMYVGVNGMVGEMMCYLYQHKLTYPHVIWILSNNDGENWYNTATDDCSVEEIRQATHGIIHIGYLLNSSSVDDILDVTNKTFDQFYQSYVEESRKYASERKDSYNSSLLNSWATVAYDSMWTLGLALHNADKKLSQFNSSLTDFTLGNYNISGAILEELAVINFAGASGRISFDETHSRFLTIKIDQVQNGALKQIGLYYPSSNNSVLGELVLYENELLWSEDSPPLDVFITELSLTQTWAGILMLVFLIVGFVWNSFSMLINFCYQNFPTIKASSPQLNYMIFAGNNLLLLSAVLLVIRTITEHDMVIFSTLCQITQWLFDLGLLLVLNMTLLKSWRIYRIFNSFRNTPGKLITDNAFIAASIGWITINTTYHILFALVNKSNFGKERFLPIDDQVRQKVVYCLPPDLIGLFYVPHVMIAIILCLLAFFIRRIQHKQFNDAKNIAMFFYTTVPIAIICLTLSAILSPVNGIYNLATVSLILDCIAICCVVYMCQLTLFVPKMLPLFRHLYCRR